MRHLTINNLRLQVDALGDHADNEAHELLAAVNDAIKDFNGNPALLIAGERLDAVYEVSDGDDEGFNPNCEAIYFDGHDDDDGLEMYDDSCGECGHPYKRGDETHYPECSRIRS